MVIRGRSLIFGAWAQIRLVRMQARLDCAHGRDTAGFVTGHRGSPLGGVDFAMGNAMRPLDARRVRFMPAINEEAPGPPRSEASASYPMPSARSKASSRSGTARVRASIAPATCSGTATRMACPVTEVCS